MGLQDKGLIVNESHKHEAGGIAEHGLAGDDVMVMMNNCEPDEGPVPLLLASLSTHTTTNPHSSPPTTNITRRLSVCPHPGTRRIVFKPSPLRLASVPASLLPCSTGHHTPHTSIKGHMASSTGGLALADDDFLQTLKTCAGK